MSFAAVFLSIMAFLGLASRQPVPEAAAVSLAGGNVTIKLGTQTIMEGLPSVANWGPLVHGLDLGHGWPADTDLAAWHGQPFGPLVLRSFSGRTMNVRHQNVTYTMTFTPSGDEVKVSIKLLNKGPHALLYPAISMPPIPNTSNVDQATSQVDEWNWGWGVGDGKFAAIRFWRRLTSAYVNYTPTGGQPFQVSAALHQFGSAMHLWHHHHEWISYPIGRRHLTCYQKRTIMPGETWTTQVWLRLSRDTSPKNGLAIQKKNLTALYGKPSDNYQPLDTRPTVALFTSDPSRIGPADPKGNARTMGTTQAESDAWRNTMMGHMRLRNCAGCYAHAGFACYAGEEHYQFDSMDLDDATLADAKKLQAECLAANLRFGWLMRPEVAVWWERSGRKVVHQSHPDWLARSLERFPDYGYIDTMGMGERDIELLAALRKKHGKKAIWFIEFPTDVSAFLTPSYLQANGEGETSDQQHFWWVGPITPDSPMATIKWLTDGHHWGTLDAGNMDMAKRFRFARELGLQPVVHSYEFWIRPWPEPTSGPQPTMRTAEDPVAKIVRNRQEERRKRLEAKYPKPKGG